MKLPSLVSDIDRLLQTPKIFDYPGAVNGLQIGNSGPVTRIVAAVDACEAVIAEASRVKAHRTAATLLVPSWAMSATSSASVSR